MRALPRVLAALALAIILSVPASAAERTGVRDHGVKFQVPEGTNALQYAAASAPDELNWGPTALAAAPDGSFWLANSAVDKLTHLGADGTVLG
ncbi:MAG: hypothetical protein M3281_02350, partial [Chloroflexota bacterium]|nr:hypothetical protein [Chloroflexota bacterium]